VLALRTNHTARFCDRVRRRSPDYNHRRSLVAVDGRRVSKSAISTHVSVLVDAVQSDEYSDVDAPEPAEDKTIK